MTQRTFIRSPWRRCISYALPVWTHPTHPCRTLCTLFVKGGIFTGVPVLCLRCRAVLCCAVHVLLRRCRTRVAGRGGVFALPSRTPSRRSRFEPREKLKTKCYVLQKPLKLVVAALVLRDGIVSDSTRHAAVTKPKAVVPQANHRLVACCELYAAS